MNRRKAGFMYVNQFMTAPSIERVEQIFRATNGDLNGDVVPARVFAEDESLEVFADQDVNASLLAGAPDLAVKPRSVFAQARRQILIDRDGQVAGVLRPIGD